MPKLPVISDKQMTKILEQKGFVLARRRGSHWIYRKPGFPLVVVPVHNKEIKRGLLAKIIKDAEIDISEL